ncbi:DNA-binding response regulator [Embleya hyalina]|uniref:HTH luxR-type domain-containing protein n=1 Tax=Embleya hyalina TaxID=516124 RepID=A0A401Z2X8_9ACTN|nr:DNA-binding response regulator [Embleya hyalina]GCE01108.1 hypothetical protein EHYA_08864 [Embleya hyalina]
MREEEELPTVCGDAELIARAGHLFESVRTEFLCAARDLGTWSRLRAATATGAGTGSGAGTGATLRGRTRAAGSADVTPRKLLGPTALVDEDARAHLRLVQGSGALVRISRAPLPHETILIDRRVMILAGPETPAGRAYTVTTSPTLVDGVRSLFLAIWDAAVDLDTHLRDDVTTLDAEGRAILEALGSGRTDESAAKRLGVSLRTYRRRVAELMATLDADSRFQAGLRAGEQGLHR